MIESEIFKLRSSLAAEFGVSATDVVLEFEEHRDYIPVSFENIQTYRVIFGFKGSNSRNVLIDCHDGSGSFWDWAKERMPNIIDQMSNWRKRAKVIL